MDIKSHPLCLDTVILEKLIFANKPGGGEMAGLLSVQLWDWTTLQGACMWEQDGFP